MVSDDQTCVGKRMEGLLVVYLPRPGYVGTDTVDYIVEFPKSRTTMHIEINVRPGSEKPGSESANTKADDRPLNAGKPGDTIAACAPLMS